MAMNNTASADDHLPLSALENINVDTIASYLKDRFYSSHTYTTLCDSILVSINPFSAAGDNNSDDTLREYTSDYRETDKAKRFRLPPHVFKIACDAYYYMQRTGQDQSISFV